MRRESAYIKDIEGFCDFCYDDALQSCYEKGFTPLPVRVNSNGKISFDINPDGFPIVLGYTTTSNKDEAITDIVGRYDSNEPGDYKKVTILLLIEKKINIKLAKLLETESGK